MSLDDSLERETPAPCGEAGAETGNEKKTVDRDDSTACPALPPGATLARTDKSACVVAQPSGPQHFFEDELSARVFQSSRGGLISALPGKAPLASCLDILRMNRDHCVLTSVGGKCRVTSVVRDDFGRDKVVLSSVADFHHAHANRLVDKGPVKKDKPTPISIAKYWFTHPERRQARTLCFRPGEPDMVDGNLNLWRGFGVKQAPGDWSLMQAHIRDVLASGDAASCDYIVRWAAWAVQNPGEPAEAVLVFRGKKGTGKGAFASAIKDLFGQHGLQIANTRHLTGNFNGQLSTCALLFADEAIAPNDKASESVLKAIITEKSINIERKGIDPIQERNRLHVIMASNEAWVVPASSDERRFACFDVSDKRRGDHAYFTALFDELARGGLQAMLYDLLAMPLGDWHPGRNVPSTAGLTAQKIISMRGVDRMIYGMLESGNPYGFVQNDQDTGNIFVATSLAAEQAGKSRNDETAIGRALSKCARTASIRLSVGEERHRGYWLPPLRDARANWAAAHGLDIKWPDSDGWIASDVPPATGEETPF